MFYFLPLCFVLSISLVAQASDCNFAGEYTCKETTGATKDIKILQDPLFNMAYKKKDGKYYIYYPESLPLDGSVVATGRYNRFSALCSDNKINI